ncbi:MAG: YraN family protein, partial [Defluviitaleaceae bacterium]|nr:YraN family protein [Defluviitaleaceae bacterium]
MPDRYKTGMYGQRLAEEYLAAKKWEIVDRNFKTRGGEIDIVVRDGDYLVFAEVKYRRSLAFGEPAEAVTEAKRRALKRAAEDYLYRKFPEAPENESQCASSVPDCRFDVISIY